MSVHRLDTERPRRRGAPPRRRRPTARPSSPFATYLARLAPRSRLTGRWAATVIAMALGYAQPEVVPWHTLTYAQAVLACARWDTGRALGTRRHLRGVLRSILREAWRAGLMDADAMLRASDLPPVAGTPPPAGRALTREQVRTLLASFAPTPAGQRDRALCVLAVATGLRRAELTALRLADYDATTGDVLVRSGKGARARTACLVDPAARAVLAAWLATRGPTAGPLFCALARRHTIRPTAGLSGARVQQLVSGWGRTLGVPVSPHDLRRTAITWLLDGGVDLDAVRAFAGHQRISTTLIYRRTTHDLARDAAQRLALPL